MGRKRLAQLLAEWGAYGSSMGKLAFPQEWA